MKEFYVFLACGLVIPAFAESRAEVYSAVAEQGYERDEVVNIRHVGCGLEREEGETEPWALEVPCEV